MRLIVTSNVVTNDWKPAELVNIDLDTPSSALHLLGILKGKAYAVDYSASGRVRIQADGDLVVEILK